MLQAVIPACSSLTFVVQSKFMKKEDLFVCLLFFVLVFFSCLNFICEILLGYLSHPKMNSAAPGVLFLWQYFAGK